jgi:L-alanine-DL-glutamate epimerase-like enolase superfamily enzyme
MLSRRNFLKLAGLSALGAMLFPSHKKIIAKNFGINMNSKKLTLRYKPYTLNLKHVFTVAAMSRTTTPVMLVELEYDRIIGYGEASMPPYLGESQESVAKFLSKLNLEQFNDPFRMEDILEYVDKVETENNAAKAAVDIALHDLVGKLVGQPWYKLWGFNPEKTPYTTFTIGIDTAEVVKKKTEEAKEFKILKVKLGKDNDKEMIEAIRSVTNVPLTVDVNQGWKDKNFALDMIYWLKEKGVVFVEQPMPIDRVEDHAWLTEKSPLPIIGDEAIKRMPDLIKAKGVYSGVNIKLMKSTGLKEAYKMWAIARGFGMKVMIGCMTETSCAISAASQLSPVVDWADLDGALLISNDVFKGVEIIDGKVTLYDKPGIGVVKI